MGSASAGGRLPALHRCAAGHEGCNSVPSYSESTVDLVTHFEVLGRDCRTQGAFSAPGSSWSPRPAIRTSLQAIRTSLRPETWPSGSVPAAGAAAPRPPGTPISKAAQAAWTPCLGVEFLPLTSYPPLPRGTLPALLTGPKLPNSSDACHICGRATQRAVRALHSPPPLSLAARSFA